MPFNPYATKAEETCSCDYCKKYRATKREAEQAELDAQSSSFEFDGLSEAGRDVLGFHRVVNKLISLKLMEPSLNPDAITLIHELMRITDGDKVAIAREVVTSAKQEKPQTSGLLDTLLNIFTESIAEASKAS